MLQARALSRTAVMADKDDGAERGQHQGTRRILLGVTKLAPGRRSDRGASLISLACSACCFWQLWLEGCRFCFGFVHGSPFVCILTLAQSTQKQDACCSNSLCLILKGARTIWNVLFRTMEGSEIAIFQLFEVLLISCLEVQLFEVADFTKHRPNQSAAHPKPPIQPGQKRSIRPTPRNLRFPRSRVNPCLQFFCYLPGRKLYTC